MLDKIIKPFTVTSAAAAAGLILMRVFQNQDKKRKSESIENELKRLHDVQKKEIEKNNQTSEETLKMIADLNSKLSK